MVRSKEVPKKPKDPLLTPPSKPRGFSFRDDGGGFGGSLPRNRGGAAMCSPAPASVPNYMRGTSSSGAKAGQRAGAPSSSPARQRRPLHLLTRGKVLFPAAPAAAATAAAGPGGMARPTCSSTLKETKFPGALDLAPGATDAQGPAAMRVCPYTYCSLNGHTHSPAVPLRSFLAKRRRLIKTQQSMKHRGISAFRRGTGHQSPEEEKIVCAAGGVAKAAPPLEALGDFFVEVYSGPRVSSGTSCSDMSLDEMDAAVRRMEFVVFDRCGVDGDSEKGNNDLGVCGDGDGRPEEKPGVCTDSSSECSDAGVSGNLVEELPWMRYECDSVDDDVSEEQGVIHEEIEEAEVLAQGHEGKDEEGTSGGFGDEREEEADEQRKPEDRETFSDLSREMGIIAEEEGSGCRVDTMHQQEASTGQETHHRVDNEECISDVAHKMEIAKEQACTVCTVDACKEQEENYEDDILDNVCQGDSSDGQSTSEEKVSDRPCESEILEFEVAARVESVTEDICKEDNSADHEAKDDKTNMDSVGRLEIAEKQKDGESEMEISGTVPDVAGKESEMEISETVPDLACEEDFFEQEATAKVVSEGEVSVSSGIGSPNVETSNQPTSCGFEQDASTVEDAFEQDASTVEDAFEQDACAMDNSFEQLDATVQNTVSGAKDAQKGLEITPCKSEDGPEESGITQGSSQEFNFVCVAQMEQEIAECKLENSSEDSGIPQESIQSDKSAHVNNGAQIEVCDNAHFKMEPEITACKLEGCSRESSIAQEIVHDDDDSACLAEGAQMQLGNVTSDLEDTSEESGIAREIGEDDNSGFDAQNGSEQNYSCADLSGGVQNESELTSFELTIASEASDILQEAVSDDSTADVNDGPQKDSEIIAQEIVHDDDGNDSACLAEGVQMQLGNVTSDLEDTSEESGIAHEIGEDDNSGVDAQNGSEQDFNCADLSGGVQNESELTSSELTNASEASDILQEAVSDDDTADVNDGPQKDSEIIACESEHAHEIVNIITQEGNEDDYTTSALKETQITTCETKDATEEGNLMSIGQTPGHSSDLSAIDAHEEPQNLPAEDTDAKVFSVDDMCNVFSGMKLKGDVYIDPTESEISPRKRLIIAGRRRTPEEEEYMRGFYPRAPNFLPLELDPDSEKVDLKHQTAEDRKNAEEWMIDYALRRAVNNLGPARKKKVELLVQAFETVLPHEEDDKKNITPTRPAQACN